jgi:hypothetical protein
MKYFQRLLTVRWKVFAQNRRVIRDFRVGKPYRKYHEVFTRILSNQVHTDDPADIKAAAVNDAAKLL